MKEWKNVWILAEAEEGKLSNTSYELLHIGRRLADELGEKLCAVLLGHQVQPFIQDLIEHGADVVYVCDAPQLEYFLDDVYGKVLADLITRYKPNKFLLPATYSGRALAAKAAVWAQTGLTAHTTELSIHPQDGQLYATRPTFGGNLMATITCTTRPEMCSVPPMTYPKAQKTPGRRGEIVSVAFDVKRHTSLVKFLKFIQSENKQTDLSQARVIVAGGRGLGDAEGFKLLEKLAASLGGVVAATRPPVDSGWLSADRQIGVTGQTVKPKLYIACGISGQAHHMAGVNADVVVAINKDPQAPLMQTAHYAVQGDLYEIIPAMLDALK